MPRRSQIDDQDDLVTPAWRRFLHEYCAPAWRLERCTLDELQRLARAIPYLQWRVNQAIAAKKAG
jgi:hypothetical protein